MLNSFYSLLPVFFVIGAFYFIVKRKRGRQARRLNRKDDIWYIVKEYLKLSGRQGHQIADLSLYPRAQTISTLREYIREVRQSLKIENARLQGVKLSPKKLKRQVTWNKLIPYARKEVNVFPKEEEYQRTIELKTLTLLAKKYSIYREYLDIYKRVVETERFKKLIKRRLIGETLSRITKQKKKIISRNRYLVCFRTISKQRSLTPWEAIEIELFKNPKKGDKEKYKILFTSSLNYESELHWIYAMQIKYFRDKKVAERQSKLEREQLERKQKTKKDLINFFLPLLTLLRIKKSQKKS